MWAVCHVSWSLPSCLCHFESICLFGLVREVYQIRIVISIVRLFFGYPSIINPLNINGSWLRFPKKFQAEVGELQDSRCIGPHQWASEPTICRAAKIEKRLRLLRCQGLITSGAAEAAAKWVCLKMLGTPKPNGFSDRYPYEKLLFHWEY